jgi:hypothetical protein
MLLFRNKIVNRMKDKFLGSEVKSLISSVLPNEQEQVMKNLMSFYNTCLRCLENSYDFTDANIFEHLKAIDLSTVEFSEFEEAIQALNFAEICEQFSYVDFYEEFSKCKEVLLETSCAHVFVMCKRSAYIFSANLIMQVKFLICTD